jgi:hypothetical protein
VDKQDCELKAICRTLPKPKPAFPKTPFCLLLDGHSPNGEIFSICEEYKWKYTITLKDDQLPLVHAEYCALLAMTFDGKSSMKASTSRGTKVSIWSTNTADIPRDGRFSICVADSLHPVAVAPQKQPALQGTHPECQIQQEPRTQTTGSIEQRCTRCGHLHGHPPPARTDQVQPLLRRPLQLEPGEAGQILENTSEQIPLQQRVGCHCPSTSRGGAASHSGEEIRLALVVAACKRMILSLVKFQR